MKFTCLPLALLIASTAFSQKTDTLLLQPVEIKAVRAGEKAPFTKTNLSKKEIEKANLGQDMPFLLNQLPSVVINADAGNGVGYTGLRIRGTDATRINMTLNGIPYNDAESQGIFFVDLPDIASSTNSIQVQRGVGTSSNGAGAFGATLNLSTNDITDTAYAEFNNSYGSFNTWKHTLKLGTGLLDKHFTLDARGSLINSGGYVDRATSDLSSFYSSAAWLAKSSSLRLNIFSGKEKTYQSWYGVSKSDLINNRTFNAAGTEKPGDPYNNQTDNYKQTHYQLFYNQRLNPSWTFTSALFLTRGKGYYEEYKASQAFANYGLPDLHSGNQLITQSDLVRQLWLDNYFYGGIFSLQQHNVQNEFTLGGGWNQYDGKHYGIVTWTQKAPVNGKHYYDLSAHKQDLSLYSKWQHQLSSRWLLFADLQGRAVKYTINGFRYNPQLMIGKNYFFLNPKAGLTFEKNKDQLYFSWSMSGKEPNRDDFEAGTLFQPKPEYLQDVELGIIHRETNYSYGATVYYMYYHNQLVLTGKINDVGAYTRTNIPTSYRLGLELQAKGMLSPWLSASGNVTISKNAIKDFTEYVDDYDNGGQKTFQYHHTDISYSPWLIAAATLDMMPFRSAGITMYSKYVDRQYLDNTSKRTRSLQPFFTEDVRFSYALHNKVAKQTELVLQVNNVFSKKYEPNGYTFSYFYQGNLSTENYYFPMAGINFMAAVNLKF